jgi:hypothetical protein
MAKRSKNSRTPASIKSGAETPKDGDLINVIWTDYCHWWDGPFNYHKRFTDPEKGELEGACAYQNGGPFALLFSQVEFWQVWEGESNEEYAERRQKIVEELERQKLPIDPIDSFLGENAIQAT